VRSLRDNLLVCDESHSHRAPYSAAKIENTISALRETGLFSPVEVDVKLDHGGLRLFALAGESTAIQSKKSLAESLPPAI
jgi:hypothetical protein